jgi:hypothetical protein
MKLSHRTSNVILSSLLLAGIVVFLSASPAASAHTFHTSLMRLEYNTKEQNVEISIQVFAHDLETILSKRAGKAFVSTIARRRLAHTRLLTSYPLSRIATGKQNARVGRYGIQKPTP